MKKIIALFLVLTMSFSIFCLTSCSQNDTVENLEGTYTREYEGTTLNVFNWGEYISDGSEGSLNVNKAFEKVTGIKVNYSTYDSNEIMYGKIKEDAVSIDVIIPSDYMIERLIKEDRIQKLDYSKITNYKYIKEDYKNLFFDEKNEYSVPYSVGMVGLIYNETMVEKAPDSWNVMWDKQYKNNIITFDNPRDAFAIAQFLLGIDLNTTDKADWDKVANKLKEQNDVLQGRVMDQVFTTMEGGNAAIAPYYAGDYLTMASNNPDLKFVYPKEGTNIFVDSICVPKSANNYEAAMMYINFLLEPEVALANAEYICYASPNTAVLNNENYSLKDSDILYPKEEDMPKTQYFHDIDPEIRSYYESLWDTVVVK